MVSSIERESFVGKSTNAKEEKSQGYQGVRRPWEKKALPKRAGIEGRGMQKNGPKKGDWRTRVSKKAQGKIYGDTGILSQK